MVASAQLFRHVRKRFEERRAHFVQALARRRQPHLVLRHALEQARPELRFELAHLLVHAGLGDGIRERTRRAGVAPLAGHPVEAFQSLNVNH